MAVFYYSLLFVFQFCKAVWFWRLLSGSGDDLCDLLPSLLWGVAIAYPLSVFTAFPLFTDSLALRLAPRPPPFSVVLSVFHSPSLLSALDYSSLLFSSVGGISLPRGCAGLFSWGVDRGGPLGTWHSPVLPIDMQVDLEPAAVAAAGVRNHQIFSV
jgi:hypothetical protein